MEFLHLTKNIQLHQINTAVIRTVDTTYRGKTKDTEGGGLRNGKIRIREKKNRAEGAENWGAEEGTVAFTQIPLGGITRFLHLKKGKI